MIAFRATAFRELQKSRRVARKTTTIDHDDLLPELRDNDSNLS